MAKVRGTISMIPKPGYPKLRRQNGLQSIEMQYTCCEADLAQLPEEGDPFLDNNYAFFLTLPVKLVSCDIDRQKSGEAYDVVLKYETPAGDTGSAAPVDEEDNYTTQDVDVPIAQHTNYKFCWNHKLAGLKTSVDGGLISTASPPLWWSAAISEEITGSDDRKNYRWFSADDQVPDEWLVLFPARRPSVESYQSGLHTINVIKRCSNKSALVADAKKDYTIESPPDTYEMTGEFLRGGSQIKRGGREWTLEVSYLNIDVIDKQVYKVYGGAFEGEPA